MRPSLNSLENTVGAKPSPFSPFIKEALIGLLCFIFVVKKGDSPEPAYAATSEQWTKFTGLRASPNYLLKARSVGVEPTINRATGFDACSTALLPVLRPYIAIGSRWHFSI